MKCMRCVQLGLTSFADLTHEEYKRHALGYRWVPATSMSI